MSKKRADAVKNYLTSKGVSVDSIIAESFGQTVPVADNLSDEGRQKNRRVEMQIVPK